MPFRRTATRHDNASARVHSSDDHLTDPLGGSQLTDPLAGQESFAPIQMDGGSSTRDVGTVREAAHKAIGGTTTELPHHDRIQSSFGKYDVSGIQAHVGPSATEATKTMGARAFAHGNHVAFGSSPDLHTAAHEAAHVMQQSRGLQLAGGVGKVGDVYEKHADAVADKVTSGQSAEGLLDNMPGGGSGDGGIQMLSIDDKPLDFSKVTKMRRSGEGTFGVYFLSEGSQTLVVKPESSTDKAVDANAILSKVGIGVPLTQVFSKGAGPAQSAIAKMNSLKGQISETHQEQMAKQIKGAKKIVVMGMVKGTAMKSLSKGDFKAAIMDPDMHEQLGKLILVDAIMGNTDRIYGGMMNLGNVMMGKDGKVTAIDSEFKISDSMYKGRKNDLWRVKDIIETKKQDGWLNDIVRGFANFLKNDDEHKLTDIDKLLLKSGLKIGINKAAIEVARTLGKGVEGLTGDDTTVAKKQAHIKELSQYMESRYRRDRLDKGFKWWGRLRAYTKL